MIYLHARGGESLLDAVNRAIMLASSGGDEVELRFARTTIIICPTFKDTVVLHWTEKHNAELTAARK